MASSLINSKLDYCNWLLLNLAAYCNLTAAQLCGVESTSKAFANSTALGRRERWLRRRQICMKLAMCPMQRSRPHTCTQLTGCVLFRLIALKGEETSFDEICGNVKAEAIESWWLKVFGFRRLTTAVCIRQAVHWSHGGRVTSLGTAEPHDMPAADFAVSSRLPQSRDFWTDVYIKFAILLTRAVANVIHYQNQS